MGPNFGPKYRRSRALDTPVYLPSRHMTSMQRRIDVSLILARHHVSAGYLFIVNRHRRRGTIEMTLIRLFVRLSVIPSVRPSVRPNFSCNFVYIFHRTDLKFYRLPSYHIKMCMWFLIFISAIFDQVMALANSYLVPQLLPHLL